jgi:hypothetical protein
MRVNAYRVCDQGHHSLNLLAVRWPFMDQRECNTIQMVWNPPRSADAELKTIPENLSDLSARDMHGVHWRFQQMSSHLYLLLIPLGAGP